MTTSSDSSPVSESPLGPEPQLLVIASSRLRIHIDPQGGDLTRIVDLSDGADVLFRTSWAKHADAVRSGRRAPVEGDSRDRWLDRYRGGWQLLCPNAGPERLIAGTRVAFHGEASTAEWAVCHTDDSSALLRVELSSVPLRIARTVTVRANSVLVNDVVTNMSDQPVLFDYVQHPAFNPEALGEHFELRVGARRFSTDPDSDGILPKGSSHRWPIGETASGTLIDLSRLPDATEGIPLFGWLSEFDDGCFELRGTSGRLIRADWDANALPYAWIWAEFSASPDWPWHRQARVIAIEPASTPTGGPGRVPSVALGARDSRVFDIKLTVENSGAA